MFEGFFLNFKEIKCFMVDSSKKCLIKLKYLVLIYKIKFIFSKSKNICGLLRNV